MEIEIQFTPDPIAETIPPPPSPGASGAWLEFRGVVRGEENGERISALEYEAYPEMAAREIRRILESLGTTFPCLVAKVIHRIGVIPVGDTAIYVGVASPHRGEAIALLAGFMDRLKQDVPVWKRRALPPVVANVNLRTSGPGSSVDSQRRLQTVLSLDEAFGEIRSRCQPLAAIPAPLAEAFGRVLRKTVCAPSDLPDRDRSTRDGYAIRQTDASESFQVVDTLHAADWRPRPLKPGETVRVATGAALPCENLRVVMQEHVERDGDKIRITKQESALNLRQRGEEVKAGQPLVPAGARLNAGKLALLASAGCTRPLVSPRLRVVHFTTGDEIVPPEHTPRPGQVRDSNSILIHGLLRRFACETEQAHLPEDFDRAKEAIGNRQSAIGNSDVLLVSGGASVGDKDFTRPLLEWLGFEIVFSQVNVRPGRPLIFGMNGPRTVFGLQGNPLSHFVCFHLFVAAALAKLTGAEPEKFRRGRLAAKLDDAPCPRETLWPARREPAGLHPLAWASSGDVTCLTEADALIRVPPNHGPIASGTEVEFLSTD
jgi:molybdopterin molybdotransferase